MNDLLRFILVVKLKEIFKNPVLLLKIFSVFCEPQMLYQMKGFAMKICLKYILAKNDWNIKKDPEQSAVSEKMKL
jgi:hypothetical protein